MGRGGGGRGAAPGARRAARRRRRGGTARAGLHPPTPGRRSRAPLLKAGAIRGRRSGGEGRGEAGPAARARMARARGESRPAPRPRGPRTVRECARACATGAGAARPPTTPNPHPFLQDSIINPDAPLALRLSGQLLLGVVRIHARKVGYLFADCNDALGRVAAAFAGADVDLADADAAAPLAAITLPASFADGGLATATMHGAFGGLGGGGGLAVDAFAASLSLGGAANFSMTGDSYLVAEDVSTLMPSSMGGGMFDIRAERAMASAGGPDLLRDATSLPDGVGGGAASALYGAADPSTKLGDTDMLEAPPGFGGGYGPDAGDAAVPAPGGYGSDDDDYGGGGGGGDGWGDAELPATPATPAGAAASLAARRRAKRARLDVDEATARPATQLLGAGIRALLEDPSPLVRARDGGADAAALAGPFAGLGAAVADITVGAQMGVSAAPRGGGLALARPLFAPFMHPTLFAAVVAAAPAAAPAPRRRKKADALATPVAITPGGDESDGWGAGDDGWGGDGGWAAGGGDDDDQPTASEPATPAAFTRRTAAALASVQAACAGAGAASLADLAAGASRLDAARWFFEALVLKNRGYVELSQDAPLGDISLTLAAEPPLATPAAATPVA